MPDLSKQLDQLRERISRLERREQVEVGSSTGSLLFGRQADPAARNPAEGREVETESGRHWELERSWPAHYRHGLSDVGALSEIPPDILCALGGEE